METLQEYQDFLDPGELSNFLKVKLSTVYYWTHINYVPHVKLGRLVRFRKSEIERWIKQKECKGRLQRKLEV